jgi:3-oxoacyl-[acyl-carrier-protein] synthase II
MRPHGEDDVVITGIGAILPGALSVDSFWAHLHAGRTQLGPIKGIDVSDTPVRVAGQLEPVDHRPYLPDLREAQAKKYSREVIATMCAVEAARADAGLGGQAAPERTGFVDSSSRGPIEWWDQTLRAEYGDPGVGGLGDGMLVSLPGSPATLAAIYSGIKGTVTTVSSACVGGNHALSFALRELQSGDADVMFAGGHDFPIVPSVIRLQSAPGRSMLSSDPDPLTALRPYNRDRDGYVMGEGAIVLCLERAEFAARRGARVYARVLGCRHQNEAAHPTLMDLSGQRTAELMLNLLRSVGRAPEEVGYICGHGIGTRYSDLAESRAVDVMYTRRGLPRPPLGSVKPVYGHLLGAASVVNIAATALMLHHQTLCPTINCTDPDPECDHDHVADGPRPGPLHVALSLSFAFGSQSSAVALERA